MAENSNEATNTKTGDMIIKPNRTRLNTNETRQKANNIREADEIDEEEYSEELINTTASTLTTANDTLEKTSKAKNLKDSNLTFDGYLKLKPKLFEQLEHIEKKVWSSKSDYKAQKHLKQYGQLFLSLIM